MSRYSRDGADGLTTFSISLCAIIIAVIVLAEFGRRSNDAYEAQRNCTADSGWIVCGGTRIPTDRRARVAKITPGHHKVSVLTIQQDGLPPTDVVVGNAHLETTLHLFSETGKPK